MRTIRSAVFVTITLALSVGARAGDYAFKVFTVAGTNPVQSLAYRVKDAEFSAALNSIVSVSDSPSQLHLYDPDTNVSFHVNLQVSPNCVSVSPDGLHAVVGHNAWISEVDLSTRTLVKTIPITANILEIVDGGNGYAYAFSTDGYVRSVNLASETSTLAYSWRNPAVARLHPAHDRIYGADRNTSPDDILRIDIAAGGLAGQGNDSIYHGDYSFCGNVWISMDGLRLVTACGNTFRASNDPQSDMRFAGRLPQETRLTWAAHSQSENSIAVLPANSTVPRTDNEIHYYTHDSLLYRGKVVLPSFVEGTSTLSLGRWLFFNADESKEYVVVQADASSGIVDDFGVVTIDCSSAAVFLAPSSTTVSASSQTVQIDVTGVGGCGWKAVSNAAWIETISSGVGDGTVTLNVAANGSSSSRSGEVAIGNATFTLTQSAPVSVEPVPPRRMASWPFRAIDAEYSKALDAIVTVSESPNRLNIYQPATRVLVTVPLGATPFCVSVGPDGKFAAVGHDHSISYVDLQNAVLVKTLNVSTNVLDIILGGNGYVYAFPRTDQWERIRAVNIASNTETLHTGNYIYAGTLARLHPAGTSIYGANNGLYPADIEKYDISAGTVTYQYDSPYHGDYSMCGNLWISEDGTRIYTACGNVFRSTSDRATDMTYAGTMENEPGIRWASNSQAAGSIAVLPSNQTAWWNPVPRFDHEVHYYSPDFLVYRGKTTLPSFVIENTSWQSRGRWHFFDATGARQYVVVQSDPESGMLYDFGVVTIDCTNAALSLDSTSANVGSVGGNLHAIVNGTDACGWKAASNVSWINTLSSGVGNGVLDMTVAENTGVTPRSGTVTVGASTFTVHQSAAVPASVVATATSLTSVSITWTFTAAHHYEVWRYSPAGSSLAGTPTAKSFTDTTASPSGAYVYKVRAVLADGSMSQYGSDYAHTYAFTDPSLAGKTIRAVHVTELRALVNAMRASVHQPLASFTDASLVGVPIKRIHITELRDAIDGLRLFLGLTPFSFSAFPQGFVLAYTTEELRNALR